jgi:hypothetical protein
MMRHSTGTWRAAPMRTQVRGRSGSGACRDHASYLALGGCPVLASQVLAQTISFYSDLPGTDFSGHSDRGGCSHQPEPRIPEAATVATHQFWGLCPRRT